MNTVFIYALNDPTTGRTRYIGKANNLDSRFYQHLRPKLRDQTHRARWVRSLGESKPVLEVLDEVPIAEWQFWEKEYIRLYRALFPDLTNATDGGDGNSNPSVETREKQRKAAMGHKPMLGKTHSIETRLKMSRAHAGSVVSEETKAKISSSTSGERNHKFGKKQSPEFVEKRVAKTRGLKRTPETRARMSDAAKLREAAHREQRKKK